MEIEFDVAMDSRMMNRIAWTALRGQFLRLWILGAAMVIFGLAVLIGGIDSAIIDGLLIFGGAIALLMPEVAFLQTRRQLAQIPPGSWHYRIDAAQIASTTPLGSGTRPWSAVHRVRESRDFWLLRMRPGNNVLGLPKDCLTADQTATFRGFLIQHGLSAGD